MKIETTVIFQIRVEDTFSTINLLKLPLFSKMFINRSWGCSVTWSRTDCEVTITNGLGPLNPGSNPGSPVLYESIGVYKGCPFIS